MGQYFLNRQNVQFIVTYYIKWVKTSWSVCTLYSNLLNSNLIFKMGQDLLDIQYRELGSKANLCWIKVRRGNLIIGLDAHLVGSRGICLVTKYIFRGIYYAHCTILQQWWQGQGRWPLGEKMKILHLCKPGKKMILKGGE